MTQKALIIFVRNPVLGKVKTRIAEAAGEKKALSVYMHLLRHTNAVAKSVDTDKFVFYSDHPEVNDIWENNIYHKYVQQGNSLGGKMQHAFEKMFSLGYKLVCIIGSDCLELTSAIINRAFEELGKQDVVIGPAKDGGYYLLGMKKIVPSVFSGKEWSNAAVYKATISDLEKDGHSYSPLPVLKDVDRIEDVPEHLLV